MGRGRRGQAATSFGLSRRGKQCAGTRTEHRVLGESVISPTPRERKRCFPRATGGESEMDSVRNWGSRFLLTEQDGDTDVTRPHEEQEKRNAEGQSPLLCEQRGRTSPLGAVTFWRSRSLLPLPLRPHLPSSSCR